MSRNVIFEDWEDWCDQLWDRSVPLLKPRKSRTKRSLYNTSRPHQPLLPHFEINSKLPQIFYDELQMRILLEHNRYNEKEEEQIVVYLGGNVILGDKLVRDKVMKRFNYGENLYHKVQAETTCPYCKHNLTTITFEDTVEREFGLLLEYCPSCTYWTWHYFAYSYLSREPFTPLAYTSFIGKVREFDENMPEGCIEEIGAWIRQNPKRWHTIHPSRFEKLVADIFRANYAHAEVKHVGKPADGGVDVVFIDADKEKWLIQVKRREKAKSSESVSTIRNLLGTLYLEDATKGIVVSTADHYSYQAYADVNRASERGMTIKLIDRSVLDHMLDGVIVDKPWLTPLQQFFPEFVPFLEASILQRKKSSYKGDLFDQVALEGLLSSYDPRPKTIKTSPIMTNKKKPSKR